LVSGKIVKVFCAKDFSKIISNQLVFEQKKLPQNYRKKFLASIFFTAKYRKLSEKLTQIKSKKQTLPQKKCFIRKKKPLIGLKIAIRILGF